MRRPDFLVIGAMKAGSTTLYNDLAGNPGVFLAEKEIGPLLAPEIQTERGVEAYLRLFARAEADQVVGDVSADYAKLPESAGLAHTARRVLGAEHRVVYSLRHPVDRLVSHHHHALARREITDPVVDSAVRDVPQLIGYSSYATQLRPFLDAVGRDRVHLVSFERYMADRTGGFAALAGFLGLAEPTTTTDPTRSFNDSADVHIAAGPLAGAVHGRAYRTLLRPFVSQSVRTRLRNLLLPQMPPQARAADRLDHRPDPRRGRPGDRGAPRPRLRATGVVGPGADPAPLRREAGRWLSPGRAPGSSDWRSSPPRRPCGGSPRERPGGWSSAGAASWG